MCLRNSKARNGEDKGDEVDGARGVGQTRQVFLGPIRDWGLHPKSNEKPLKGLE